MYGYGVQRAYKTYAFLAAAPGVGRKLPQRPSPCYSRGRGRTSVTAAP
jgi:hypothetical protein